MTTATGKTEHTHPLAEGDPPAPKEDQTQDGGGLGDQFFADVSEDTASFIKEKGWGNVNNVVESYQNLQKVLGGGGERLVIPKPGSAGEEEAWGNLWNQLGRPEKPDGYDFKEQLGEAGADTDLGWFRETAHANGLTDKQARNLLGAYMGEITKATEAQQADFQAKGDKDIEALRKEWGKGYDGKVDLGRRATREILAPVVQEMGVELTDFLTQMDRTFGPAVTIKLFASLGERLGEHKLVEGQGGGGGTRPFHMTPSEARAAIAAKKANKDFMAAYLNPKDPGYTKAHEEMRRLYDSANPE